MTWYKRATKHALDTIQNASCTRISFGNHLLRSPSIATATRSASSLSVAHGNNAFISHHLKQGFSGRSQICSNIRNHLGGLRQYNTILLCGAARRNYYVDSRQVYHFKRRGYRGWFKDPRNALVVVLIGSGLVVTVYFGNIETVPYTKRRHCVLLSRSLEMQLGESQFDQIKAQFKGEILPPLHPDSIKVRLIARDIIEALQRGLSHEQVWSEPGYGTESPGIDQDHHAYPDAQGDTLLALGKGAEFKMEQGDWRKEGEILDDRWVKDSRRKGEARGMQPTTDHLKGLKWEVLVVNKPVVNAFCMPGGKIVVFTGLLDHFKTDAEIATIIGHEVGHAVARHAAEQITKNMWLVIIQMILFQFVDPNLIHTMSNLLLRLPFSRKMEIEADYIGVLLTASAGYDPRVAPAVYEKLGKVSGDSAMRDYLSTHPSGKTRAQLLARAQVMEEAMAVYREAIAGRGIEGFL